MGRIQPECFAVKGFSLIEVATALAIFAFALVGLISLLPMAITTHRQAVGNTVIAQITQQLTGEVQMCGPNEFAKTYTQQNQVWYFDYQGNQTGTATATTGTATPSPAPSTNPGTVYIAEAIVTPSTTLPGSTGTSTCLQTVQIYAAFDPTSTGTLLLSQINKGAPNGVVVVNQPTVVSGVGGL